MTDNGGHIFKGDGSANNFLAFNQGSNRLFSLGISSTGFSNLGSFGFRNGSETSNSRLEISLANDNQLTWYNNSATIGHRIRYGSFNHVGFFLNGDFGWRGFTVGGDDRISTEDISLQGSTLIKGNGTSTGSALSIYNNDTTPFKQWDFLDNGRIIRVGAISIGENQSLTDSRTISLGKNVSSSCFDTVSIWQSLTTSDNYTTNIGASNTVSGSLII